MPGFNLPLRVRHPHDDRVVDHVLRRLRLQAHLLHLSLEMLVRIGLYRKPHVLPIDDRADVALVHRRQDLHLRQVVRDEEQLRRLHARDHGLPELDGALDDDAVDRRVDLRVAKDSALARSNATCALFTLARATASAYFALLNSISVSTLRWNSCSLRVNSRSDCSSSA